MKSARMLIIAAGLCGLMLSGCMETNFGIARPFVQKPAANGEPVDKVASTETPAPAAPAKQPNTGSVVSGDSADSSDPKVVALTKRIETLASRNTNSTAPKNPQADAAEEQTMPTVTDTRQRRANPESGRRNEMVRRPVEPASAEIAPSMTANMSVGVNTPVGSTQRSASAGMAETAQTEVTASPTPRPVPIVQPTMIAPQPTDPAAAAANVGVEIVDVRPVVTPVVPSGNKTASANQPAEGGRNARATDLKGLIVQLEQASQQQPPQPEDTLRLRLLYLAAGQDDKAIAPIKDMDPMQAELLTAIVKTVASSRQAMVQQPNANSAPSALTAADELRRLLGQQSGITIPRMALVTKVTSYGDYESLSPARFKAGSEIHAYVYTEIANFRSEPVDGDRLHTLLGEKVQVFDSTGKTIWERHENNIEDRVRTPRRDFFIPFPVHLPANLAPGDYVLKVTVEDHIGGSTDQQRLSFSIQ